MKIGVIGSGNIGGTVGTLWARAGHEVLFASRHPEELEQLIAQAHAFGTPPALVPVRVHMHLHWSALLQCEGFASCYCPDPLDCHRIMNKTDMIK
jgi:lactate dehydrogenase-like 2-hydroxyacid dehydrogenase